LSGAKVFLGATLVKFPRLSFAPEGHALRHLVNFLISKDRTGRTVVHVRTCDRKVCKCPRRLAAGSVDSIIGKLRAVCNKLRRFNHANPVSHSLVKEYLKFTREEQASLAVTRKQAVPLFFTKFMPLIGHFRVKIVIYPHCISIVAITLDLVMGGIRSRPRQSPCSTGTACYPNRRTKTGKNTTTPPESAKPALFYKPPFHNSDPHTPSLKRTVQIQKTLKRLEYWGLFLESSRKYRAR